MQKYYLVLISLLLLSTTSNALFEDAKIMKQVISLQDMQPIVLGFFDHLSFVVFWHEECTRCNQVEQPIEKFTEQFNGIIKFFHVDCQVIWNQEDLQKVFPMCDPKYTQHLPMISFFEPPKQKLNPYTKKPNMAQEHKYEGEVSPKSFSAFAKKYLPVYYKKINNVQTFDEFLQTPQYTSKVILFTNKNESTALYKGISAEFNGRILFGEVHSSVKELVEQYKINDFPTLMVFNLTGKDDYSNTIYKKELKYSKLMKFLQPYALKDRIPMDQMQGGSNDTSSTTTENDQQQQEQQSQKDVQQTKLPEVTSLPMGRYEKVVLQEERPFLIHIFNGEVEHPQWQEVQKKYGNMFIYHALNVNTTEADTFAKEKLFIKNVPAIKFLPPGTTKKPYSKISFSNSSGLNSIHQELQDLIPDDSISLANATLQMHLASALQEGKFMLIYFTNVSTTSLNFRVAGQLSIYKEKCKFYTFKKAPQEILKQFQITTFPKMVVLFRNVDPKDKDTEIKPEQIQLAHYQGKFNWEELANFIDQFILKEDQKSGKKITQIKTQKDLTKLCTVQSQQCFIALLDGTPEKLNVEKDEETKLQIQQRMLEKVKDKFGNRPISFGWIDATCHSEILSNFELQEDSLPNFISYSHSKKQYSKMIGRFEQDSLNLFVENTLKLKVAFNNITFSNIEITEKDCEEEHEKLLEQKRKQSEIKKQSTNEPEDDILKEILEEENKKKKLIEDELKQEKKKNKKGTKGKGKGKKKKSKKSKDDL